MAPSSEFISDAEMRRGGSMLTADEIDRFVRDSAAQVTRAAQLAQEKPTEPEFYERPKPQPTLAATVARKAPRQARRKP